MSDDNNALSQEQIDALLSGGGDDAAEPQAETAASETAAAPAAAPEEAPAASPTPETVKASAAGIEGALTDSEKDAIGEIGNISLGTAATTLSTLINRKVEITLPQVREENIADLKKDFPEPCVVLNVEYIEGLQGTNILFLSEKDAAVLASLMMGGDGKPESDSLDEMQLSAVTESMNQMMGTAATSMASMIDKSINISPPQGKVLKLDDEQIKNLLKSEEEVVVTTRFKMIVEDLLETAIVQIQPIPFAKELVESLVSKHAPEPQAAAPAPPPQAPPAAAAAPAVAPPAAAPPAGGMAPPPAPPD